MCWMLNRHFHCIIYSIVHIFNNVRMDTTVDQFTMFPLASRTVTNKSLCGVSLAPDTPPDDNFFSFLFFLKMSDSDKHASADNS